MADRVLFESIQIEVRVPKDLDPKLAEVARRDMNRRRFSRRLRRAVRHVFRRETKLKPSSITLSR